MLQAVASSRDEFKVVARFFDAAIAIVGLALAGIAVYAAAQSFRDTNVPSAIRSLVLPPLLTVGLFPAVFAVAVFTTYENFCIRFGAWRPGRGLIGRFAAIRVLAFCGCRPHAVHEFGRKYAAEIMNVKSRTA